MKIDKNVPIPKGTTIRGYPWPQMEPGDSVNFKSWIEYRCARQSSSAYGIKHQQKYMTRKNAHGGGGRVWRVK